MEKTSLRNCTLYSIFVRNCGGTFAAVEKDLERIRDLGVDIIWLMPIHPVGEKHRKGTLGSPYAIRDYRAVNPEYGTLADFASLCDTAHGLGLKVMIDVVYNHTSPDSWLSENHPEWFYHKPDGSFGNRTGDWWDVIDLDYANEGLWDYQIDTLKYWAQYVDGFRCDVAPMVPLAFWKRAREEVAAVREDCIWLSESIEPGFLRDNRARGLVSHSDCEMYQAFDVLYDYDVYGDFLNYVLGKESLEAYVYALERQESIYPADYVKLRFLENHDRPRAKHLLSDDGALMNWTAWMFFQKGMALLYAGQEGKAAHQPGLFDMDEIMLTPCADMVALIKTMINLKKQPIFAQGAYRVEAKGHDIVYAEYALGDEKIVGVFSLRGKTGLVQLSLADGAYENLITGETVYVEGGLLSCKGNAIVLKTGNRGK